MKIQTWLSDPQWTLHDPKLTQVASQPVQLKHTLELGRSIPLDPAGIILVRGPRQVGKSTFLRQFVVRCLKAGIPPADIALFDAERFESRHHMLGELETFIKEQHGRTIVLIDELTSVEKWWLAIKALADAGTADNSLIIGTGSSAVDLQAGADLMPGRRGKRHPVDFELLPVSYKDLQKQCSVEDYLLTGGMPWAINEYIRVGTIPAYVYELYASWIKGIFQKRRYDIRNLPFLLSQLIVQSGTPVSVQKLTRDCGMGSNHTTENYLELLELAYAVLPSFWTAPEGGPSAPRKNRKFYPSDPFLYHLFAEFDKGWETAFQSSRARLQDAAEVGRMVESLVAAEVRRRTGAIRLGYWLGTREIDFVGDEIIEVKYRNHVSVDEFSWAEKILGKDQVLTVVTKQDNAVHGRIRLVDLQRWLCIDPKIRSR